MPSKSWQCGYNGLQLFYWKVALKILGNPHENLFDKDASMKPLFACNSNIHGEAIRSKKILVYAKSMNIYNSENFKVFL